MRLRDRPWKLLATAVLGTLAMIAFSIALLSGHVETRHFGEVSRTQAPVRYSLLVIGCLLAWGMVFLSWLSLFGAWNQDYRLPLKPPIDDPDKRRPMAPRPPPAFRDDEP